MVGAQHDTIGFPVTNSVTQETIINVAGAPRVALSTIPASETSGSTAAPDTLTTTGEDQAPPEVLPRLVLRADKQ